MTKMLEGPSDRLSKEQIGLLSRKTFDNNDLAGLHSVISGICENMVLWGVIILAGLEKVVEVLVIEGFSFV